MMILGLNTTPILSFLLACFVPTCLSLNASIVETAAARLSMKEASKVSRRARSYTRGIATILPQTSTLEGCI